MLRPVKGSGRPNFLAKVINGFLPSIYDWVGRHLDPELFRQCVCLAGNVHGDLRSHGMLSKRTTSRW